MAFPSKTGVGVNLTYGLDGIGILNPSLLEKNSSTQTFKLPRVRNSKQRLISPVPNSFQIHSKGYKTETEQQKSYGMLPLPQRRAIDNTLKHTTANNSFFIPHDAIKTSTINSETFIHPKEEIDPCEGDVVKILEFPDLEGWSKRYLLLTADGPLRNLVTFTSLEEGFNPVLQHRAPPFYVSNSVSFPSKVNHIAVSPYRPSSTQTIAVMTVNSVHVFRVIWKTEQFVLEPAFKIGKADLAGFQFAHVEFNPAHSKIAVVDVKGNFEVYGYKSHRFHSSNWTLKTIYDPVELSNFKKIIWSNEGFYLMTRSSLHMVDYLNATCKLVANAWSKLVDYVSPVDENGIGFLLTTREIIVVDELNGFKRLLGWNHYLSEKDLSMKLKVIPTLNKNYSIIGYTCMVTSRMYPITFALEFLLTGNGPVVLNSPYLFSLQPKKPIFSYDLVPCEDSRNQFICYQLLDNLEISSVLLAKSKDKEFKSVVNNDNVKIPSLNDSTFGRNVSKDQFSRFYSFLGSWHMPKEEGEDGVYQAIQEYGTSLSDTINEFISRSKDQMNEAFIDHGNTPKFINLYTELQSMISQLMQFYDKQLTPLSFKFDSDRWLTIKSKLKDIDISDQQNFEGLTSLKNGIGKLFPLEESLPSMQDKICQDLALSSITITRKDIDTKTIDDQIGSAQSGLSAELSKLVDSFSDDEDTVQSNEHNREQHSSNKYLDSYVNDFDSQINIPSFSISKGSSQKKRKPFPRLDTFQSFKTTIPKKPESQPDMRLLSSQPVETQSLKRAASQVVRGAHGANGFSNGRPKKKRKKKTGFL
ncbi:unnamed protein product [Ambrosiozyma monospora]|uniref:Unnamed protein product n=1 Tax=Ambrosiozyma monospora TaxID=43982 RepID=A0ACB5SSZ9_AMBMO|nr:unnamed protein product [Ambrosiozyma monospora]